MPTIKQNLTTVNYTPRGTSPTWIVVHNTANGTSAEGTAYNNTQYFKNTNRNASATYFIDDGDTIWQCVRDTDTAWHCGEAASRNGCYNYNSVGIEVCEPSGGRFTEKEISNLAWLVKRLMDWYGIDADHVCRHYDVTGKNCPWYYVDDSAWADLKARIVSSEGWVHDNTGWWYRYSDGSYPKNTWAKIGDYWYLLGKDGYMLTGWQKKGDFWYYLDIDGHMLTGWQEIRGRWYLLDTDGHMLTGWQRRGGKWYYLDPDGAMVTGWLELKEGWYYLDSSGSMVSDTVAQIGTYCFAFDKSGLMITDAARISVEKWGGILVK